MKSIFESRTFWLNLASLIAVVIDQVGGYGWIPEEAMAVLATINIGLRAITSQPVALVK